jgi:hypothetical protein
MSHINNGHCPECQIILDRFPNFNSELRKWFEEFQGHHPEMHTSEGGRGRINQERDFQKRASRAHYLQSAHNYGCGMDLFVILPKEKSIYPVRWFCDILYPALPAWIVWLGAPNSTFPELPHIELKNWKQLVAEGLAKPVE